MQIGHAVRTGSTDMLHEVGGKRNISLMSVAVPGGHQMCLTLIQFCYADIYRNA
jgi:hypothetical protein